MAVNSFLHELLTRTSLPSSSLVGDAELGVLLCFSSPPCFPPWLPVILVLRGEMTSPLVFKIQQTQDVPSSMRSRAAQTAPLERLAVFTPPPTSCQRSRSPPLLLLQQIPRISGRAVPLLALLPSGLSVVQEGIQLPYWSRRVARRADPLLQPRRTDVTPFRPSSSRRPSWRPSAVLEGIQLPFQSRRVAHRAELPLQPRRADVTPFRQSSTRRPPWPQLNHLVRARCGHTSKPCSPPPLRL